MRTRLSRTPWQAWRPLAAFTAIALMLGLAAPVAAQELAIANAIGSAEVKGAPTSEGKSASAGQPRRLQPVGRAADAPLGQGLVAEVEPNGTFGQATPLGGSNVAGYGTIVPNGDIDFWSFSAVAGDKAYVATMTGASNNGSTDAEMDVLDVDGVTVLEFDGDNGVFGGLASSVAGVTLPASGTYYVRVRHFSATNQLRPYRLHFQLRSGVPDPEIEPNDAAPQPLPASGWVTGDTSAVADVDRYSLALNAGDSVYVSLDLDPERDTTEWNGQLGLAPFGGFLLTANDAGGAGPDSEAYFHTVQAAGTYEVFVMTPGGGTTFGTYHLNVSVIPSANQGLNCTTYTSTDTPLVIPDGPGQVNSTIVVPGNPRIADVDVQLNLNHLNPPDLDLHLMSPAGNDNGLVTDIGSGASAAQQAWNFTLDDEAAIVPSFTVLNGSVFMPEAAYMLNWFDGENGGGSWTLAVRDDLAVNGGTLNSWSLRICEAPPVPACGPGFQPVTVYSSDFEATDGGFTHSGTLDEWERGLPTVAPITTCNSGSNCWKTDLDATYDASSNQDLLSPSIPLAGLTGPVVVSWAQRYHIESATFDHWNVTAREVGNPTNGVSLFDWIGADMRNSVGNPSTPIEESAGWGVFTRSIDFLAGLNAELVFHLDSDSSVQFTGPAIDDVTVTACEPAAPASITMSKTVGLVSGVCGVDETLTVPFGTPVTYCYTVTNTGGVTLNYHTVVDDQLGTVLDNLNFVLAPAASTFFTVDDVVLTGTTTNNATWTASESVTSTTVCSSPALAIPDGTPAGVNDAMVVAVAGNLSDLDISLDLSHTWVGDVAFTLTDGTTTAAVFDRPGVPASTFGCDGVDVDAVLDDSGATPVETECGAGVPSIAGTFSPNVALAGFNGAPFAGTWTLNAADFATPDPGTLNEWCLIGTVTSGSVSASDSVTVTVQPQLLPDIAVNPTSLSSFQSVDTQVNQNLDITNNGDANLDWTITEDAGLVGNRVVAQVPGRQQPILPHRPSTLPPANAVSTGDHTFSRSTHGVAGERVLPRRGDVPDATITLSHSVTQTIAAGNSVACTDNLTGFHVDNSYIRAFDLPAFGINGGFAITQVEVGIEVATGTGGTQPGTVNLYTWDPLDPFTFANFVLIGTANALVPDQAATIITIPVTGSAPAGSNLVVEFFTPDGVAAGHSLFVGSNPDGQTAPTFLAAAGCGIAEPTDVGGIGFPNMHLVMNVTGSTGCDVDLPWLSASPAAGTTAPAATTPVTVTFDSTGLVQGATYTGALCIQSNDPDTPELLVPVTLEVDGMDFSDGFETNDTSRWSVSVMGPI